MYKFRENPFLFKGIIGIRIKNDNLDLKEKELEAIVAYKDGSNEYIPTKVLIDVYPKVRYILNHICFKTWKSKKSFKTACLKFA